MKYIDRFTSLVPAIQGNKIVRKIEDLRAKGQIQTEAEYNEALESLLSNISTVEFKPLFQYTPIVPSISSSEHFNEMMDTIRDDLEVLFLELSNIYAAVKAHDTIFKDKLLNELNFTLTELEAKANNLSLVSDISNSFDEVITNSFSGDSFSLDINSEHSNELYFDVRKGQRIQSQDLTFIDVNEQVISLPLVSQREIPFASASVRTAETTASQVDIQLADSNISNILDADSSSSWAYNVLLKNELPLGSKLSLELDLGDKRIINFLNIHPIADFPVLLEKIEYIDINNQNQDLPDSSNFNKTLQNPIRITFPDILAKKIILKLSQASAILFDYDINRPVVTFDDLKRNTRISRSASILSDNIRGAIQDPNILSILPITNSLESNFEVYYQYVFAFKDITAGLSSYRNDGYFISKPYQKSRTGLIALDSSENIPVYFDEMANANAKIASFEYSLIKKDYNGLNNFIQTKEFNILPLGSTSIDNERLFFTGSSKVIPLRFLGHGSDDKGTDIKILRNNIELVRGTDWRFFDRANQLDDADDDLAPGLSETKIEILHDSNVITSGIYTAEYAPRYLSEPNNTIQHNNIIYLSNSSTEHNVISGVETIENSELFIKIVIRNNSSFNNRTPKLDFYKVLMSSANPDKYVRL